MGYLTLKTFSLCHSLGLGLTIHTTAEAYTHVGRYPSQKLDNVSADTILYDEIQALGGQIALESLEGVSSHAL